MLYWRFRWYIYPRHRYATRCQYCAAVTGETMHAWATEDICAVCAAPLQAFDDAVPEYIVETGDVGGAP
jgi:hypothetical protein